MRLDGIYHISPDKFLHMACKLMTIQLFSPILRHFTGNNTIRQLEGLNQMQLKEIRKTCKLQYVIQHCALVIETVMRIAEKYINKFIFNFFFQFCGRLTKNEQENSHCNFGCIHNRINIGTQSTSINIALLQCYQC